MNLVSSLIKKVATEKQTNPMNHDELKKFLDKPGDKYFEDLLLIAKPKSVYCALPLANARQYDDLEYIDERFIQFDHMVKCVRQRSSSLTQFKARFAVLERDTGFGNRNFRIIREHDEKPSDIMLADMGILLKNDEIHIVRWLQGPSGLVLKWGKGLNFEEAK